MDLLAKLKLVPAWNRRPLLAHLPWGAAAFTEPLLPLAAQVARITGGVGVKLEGNYGERLRLLGEEMTRQRITLVQPLAVWVETTCYPALMNVQPESITADQADKALADLRYRKQLVVDWCTQACQGGVAACGVAGTYVHQEHWRRDDGDNAYAAEHNRALSELLQRWDTELGYSVWKPPVLINVRPPLTPSPVWNELHQASLQRGGRFGPTPYFPAGFAWSRSGSVSLYYGDDLAECRYRFRRADSGTQAGCIDPVLGMGQAATWDGNAQWWTPVADYRHDLVKRWGFGRELTDPFFSAGDEFARWSSCRRIWLWPGFGQPRTQAVDWIDELAALVAGAWKIPDPLFTTRSES